MKRLFSFLISILLCSTILPQTPVGTYSLGAGVHYPRFMSITSGSVSENSNYGAFLSLQRKMSEHLTLRLAGNYDHIESSYKRGGIITHRLNMLSADAGLLYQIFPCEILSPYVSAGFGATNFSSENPSTAELNQNKWGYQMNLGFGVEYNISNSFSIKSEAIYRTASDNKLDGSMRVNDKKGLFKSNGDTYITMDLGVLWNFSIGDDFSYCEDCPEGIREIYKIDTLITEVPVEVIKEVNTVDTVYIETPVLFMVHFEFNKSDLHPEAVSILEHTVMVLNSHKDIKLKIIGHTDSKGSLEYNKVLSEKRAKRVFDYLVSKGISADRLTMSAMGEERSIDDNRTTQGRAFNRRVEFKVEETYTATTAR